MWCDSWQTTLARTPTWARVDSSLRVAPGRWGRSWPTQGAQLHPSREYRWRWNRREPAATVSANAHTNEYTVQVISIINGHLDRCHKWTTDHWQRSSLPWCNDTENSQCEMATLIDSPVDHNFLLIATPYPYLSVYHVSAWQTHQCHLCEVCLRSDPGSIPRE